MSYDAALSIGSFPRAILHIDGDAFFASCEQSRNPALRGKPVVTGKERGIASSMSYEAKACGVTRAMPLHEIRKRCPNVVILPSDYETYSLLSKRLYAIVRRYTPDVEEYGIDECFADITGLRRPLHMSYEQIAERIKRELDTELGFTFSIGLAPNKVVAKVASKWKKPSGLTVIPAREIHTFLENLPAEKIWGIGRHTSNYLEKLGITTALQFARMRESEVRARFSKPFYEIWQELNGRFILPLTLEEKTSQASIQKMRTFTPPSNDKKFVFAQLSKNIENACIKARRYKLAARRITILLRTSTFHDTAAELSLSHGSAFPDEIVTACESPFNSLFNPRVTYRATAVILTKFEPVLSQQPDLFGESVRVERLVKLYDAVDAIAARYGKHTAFLGSSFAAHAYAQHKGDRGDAPERKHMGIKGETKRQRLNIPMFIGDVS